jgi:hypothetical protein
MNLNTEHRRMEDKSVTAFLKSSLPDMQTSVTANNSSFDDY